MLIASGAEDAGWSAGTIERIIAQDPVDTISSIDGCGLPWFEYELKCPPAAERRSVSRRNYAMSPRYREFVTHPRYGQGPRITGLNPETDYAGHVFLHWHSPEGSRIPNTAIAADLSRQSPATVPVTHYFDVRRLCRDCGKPFIFFAAEQKYWYEELGFSLDSDCVRCVVCRKEQQGIGKNRERYEELFHVADRSIEQTLEMADCCLSLVESGVFHKRQLQHMRAILKRLPSGLEESAETKLKLLWEQLHALERDNS